MGYELAPAVLHTDSLSLQLFIYEANDLTHTNVRQKGVYNNKVTT